MSSSLYLDIETNNAGSVTVIGIYTRRVGLRQYIRPDIDPDQILDALPSAGTLYTYNGHCFDLPILRKEFGIDLRERYHTIDLRFECQRIGWKGGLKQVEQQQSIPRKTAGLDGSAAVWLWDQYWLENDKQALKLLLAYNRDDVVNLVRVHRALRHHTQSR
jgi:uncharacterized protein YprB with RNaseH-like and TPR domain